MVWVGHDNGGVRVLRVYLLKLKGLHLLGEQFAERGAPAVFLCVVVPALQVLLTLL